MDCTLKHPEDEMISEMSKVPPPKSNTRRFFSSFEFWKPEVKAAAVGSLIMRRGSRPAMMAASRVDCLCVALKYAGHVTTALVTGRPHRFSAIFFISISTRAEISSGARV